MTYVDLAGLRIMTRGLWQRRGGRTRWERQVASRSVGRAALQGEEGLLRVDAADVLTD